MLKNYSALFGKALLIGGFICFVSACCAYAIQDSQELAGEALAYLNAGIEVADSVVRGDVLIEETQEFDTFDASHDDEPALIYRLVSNHRFVFDREKKSYLYFRSRLTSQLVGPDLMQKNVSEKVEEELIGLLVSDQNVHSRRLPKGVRSKPVNELPELALVDHLVPDYRLAGWMRLSHGDWFRNRENIDRHVTALASNIKGINTSKAERVELTFEFAVANPNAKKTIQTTTLEYDGKSFCLLRSKSAVVEETGVKNSGFVADNSISWEEFDGVPAPIEIVFRTPKAIRIKGRLEAVLQTTTYKLSWLSVNKDLDQRLFAVGSLEDEDKFIQMTDPTKVFPGTEANR